MQTMNTQPPRGAQPAPGGGGGQPQLQQSLSPQQIRQFEVMHKQAMRLLLREDTATRIVQQAQEMDPTKAVATIVGSLLQRLYQAAERAGQQIDMVTMLVTGVQIIGDITEMLIEAGVLEEPQAANFIGEVSRMAIEEHNARVQEGGGGAAQPGAMQ